jgi:hypothetical protein
MSNVIQKKREGKILITVSVDQEGTEVATHKAYFEKLLAIEQYLNSEVAAEVWHRYNGSATIRVHL